MRCVAGARMLALRSSGRHARRLRPRRRTRPSGVKLTVTGLRRQSLRYCERAQRTRGGDGDEPADAQRDRHAPATAAGSCRASTGSPAAQQADSRSTGSTTSTASRRPRARPRRTCTRAITSGGTCHDWSQTDDVPAVVGSFPEPFVNGHRRQTLPVRVECAVVNGYACRTVTARLRALGVPAAFAALGGGGASRKRCV